MTRNILIVQGHPDAAPERFCRALATAYGEAAEASGHVVRRIDLATLSFDLLRTKVEHDHGPVPAAIAPLQDAIAWADHIVFVFPLWLGGMPAMLKGFLEQVLRPGFAYEVESGWKRLLTGRSARIIVTMGMPALAYRFWFGGHGVRQLERSILRFVGIAPVSTTLIGRIEAMDDKQRIRWLERMRDLGRGAR